MRIAMDIFQRNNLKERLEVQTVSCMSVSIYLPTYKPGRTEVQQNPIRLKNLLGQALDRLIETGLRRPEAESYLEPAHRMLEDQFFWTSASDGSPLDYTEFTVKTEEYTGLSREDAIKVASAIVETLGEKLSKNYREHLATQLPKELEPFLSKSQKTELFSLESFYVPVSSRAGISFHEALQQSKNILRIIRQAVAEGERRDIFAEMPPEYDELLGRKPDRITPATPDTHELFP